MKGNSLYFTAIELGCILSIPFSELCPFTLKGAAYSPISPLEQLRTMMDDPTLEVVLLLKTVDVSPTTIVLHKVLMYNLLTRLGGSADFIYQDLVLIAMILKAKVERVDEPSTSKGKDKMSKC